MGHTEFLVGSGSSAPSNLPDAIRDLEEASIIFMMRWRDNDHHRAGQITQKALQLFDFISNEILREKVERLGSGTYEGSAFQAAMKIFCGSGTTNVNLQQQQAMVQAGAGVGNIASSLGPKIELTLDRLLNKIKHRNRHLMNFRNENGRHIFLICPEYTQGGAEGIYEFDVIDFCNKCRLTVSAL